MHRIDDSLFLLFIEPKKRRKRIFPKNDTISKIMKLALNNSISGTSNYEHLNETPRFSQGRGYKGYHVTECGIRSYGADFLLENGMITNSLADFYLRYYRSSIPKSEMKKVKKLVEYYKNKYRNNPEMYKEIKFENFGEILMSLFMRLLMKIFIKKNI
jgi:hypothetical protein